MAGHTARATTTLLLMLIAVAATAAPAAAQASACGPLVIAVTPGAVELAPGESTTVTVSLRNDGNAAGTASVTAAAPQGWDLQPEGKAVTLNGSETRSYDLVVKAGDAAADFTGPYAVDLTGNLRCTVAGAPFGESAPAEARVDLTLATPPVDGDAGVTGEDGMNALGYLFLAAVAVLTALGAIPIYRARRGVALRCDEATKAVEPGRGASFPIIVENRRQEAEAVRFDVTGVPEGWSAFVAVHELTLDPGEERTLWLMVRAPVDAELGSEATVELAATSRERESRVARLALTTRVYSHVEEPLVMSARE